MKPAPIWFWKLYRKKFELGSCGSRKQLCNCIWIGTDKIERFLYLIKERQEEGVKVTVITTDPEEIIYGNSDICYELIREMINWNKRYNKNGNRRAICGKFFW